MTYVSIYWREFRKLVLHCTTCLPEPGVIAFAKRGFLVKESIGTAIIPVLRKNGADGEVSVKYRTIDKSAINNRDYKGGEGVLVFKHTEVGICWEVFGQEITRGAKEC